MGATTARDGGGLWRLTFEDVSRPELGGSLELLLDGSEAIGLNKPDNITFDDNGGVLLIQEDPGNNAHVARILAFRTSDKAIRTVARFDPKLFDPAVAGANLLTQDEESSGIVDASFWYVPKPPRNFDEARRFLEANAKGGKFLFDAQAHTTTGLDDPAAQGERGQLLLLEVQDWTKVFSSPAG